MIISMSKAPWLSLLVARCFLKAMRKTVLQTGNISLTAEAANENITNKTLVCECAWAWEDGACDMLHDDGGDIHCQTLCCAINVMEQWPKNKTEGTIDGCECT